MADNLPVTIPTGYELLTELMSGTSQVDMSRKYNCSRQNINDKIRAVTNKLSPEFRDQYMKNNVPILKTIEAMHLQESVNPDRIQKMSSYQLTGMAKLIWEMRRTEEGKSTEIHENRDMILSLQGNIERFLAADNTSKV